MLVVSTTLSGSATGSSFPEWWVLFDGYIWIEGHVVRLTIACCGTEKYYGNHMTQELVKWQSEELEIGVFFLKN